MISSPITIWLIKEMALGLGNSRLSTFWLSRPTTQPNDRPQAAQANSLRALDGTYRIKSNTSALYLTACLQDSCSMVVIQESDESSGYRRVRRLGTSRYRTNDVSRKNYLLHARNLAAHQTMSSDARMPNTLASLRRWLRCMPQAFRRWREVAGAATSRAAVTVARALYPCTRPNTLMHIGQTSSSWTVIPGEPVELGIMIHGSIASSSNGRFIVYFVGQCISLWDTSTSALTRHMYGQSHFLQTTIYVDLW
ncbi:hypothetical protein EV363DRAFT_1436079 [Boletus edulis]|uniref:Uncharacterized protein n=1 Tax=Boletus edulis BED1 TaxID=1328754 RepID=A0AAD4BLR0_BOLED|nr:hypothetical protein EV363DRAFT_1436079 [Boletus edulis]KAF8433685.1 hypothetical protein L210DRAFT_546753 [Boletus edulis BED1]